MVIGTEVSKSAKIALVHTAPDGETIVLLHAWRKRTQKLDVRETARALNRLAAS